MKKLRHGTCYYPELWPESDINRDLVEMQRVGLNMVRIGEFTWSKMEPDEGKVSLDFFCAGAGQSAMSARISIRMPSPTGSVGWSNVSAASTG